MSLEKRISILRLLQQEADDIREELGISRPGAVHFRADLDPFNDDVAIVEANGFGGATTMIVEGNYPVDFLIKFERRFPTEEQAIAAADEVFEGEVSPRSILGKPY